MAETGRGSKGREGRNIAGSPAKRRWRLIPMTIALITVTGFAGGVWYAYDQGVKQGVRLKPPLIKAEPGPTKIVPEQTGGLEIPNQDKSVFDRISQEDRRPKVERLLPPPEAPKDIPAPLPPVPLGETLPTIKDPEPAAQETASDVAAGQGTADTGRPSPEPRAPEPAEDAKKVEPQAAPAPINARTDAKAGYRIQLGSFRQSDQAKAAWKVIAVKNRDLISGLVPTVVRVDLGPGKGIYHRLQAGPLRDKAAASALCGKLKAQKQACLPISPK